MAISCNINKLIKFLQEQKKEGYETVELIDDARAEDGIRKTQLLSLL